ncbi:MAG: hydrogenase maturation protease [Halobacteriota archaeon]|nr:hydrogenase maturation protease [Halobacteriota archaeon]
MRTLVFGIGNPILSDDGVGIYVAREIKKRLSSDISQFKDVDVEEGSVGGLKLLDTILGYERVILIDAIMTEGGSPGDIYTLSLDNFVDTLHISSPHDLNFATAIDLGRTNTPELMPDEIKIYAIEVKTVDIFSEELTEELGGTVSEVVEMVINDLKN